MQPTLRIYSTHLEAFRRWMVSEDKPEQELIDDITGFGLKSKWARYGTAFHAIMEDQSRYAVIDPLFAATIGYKCDDVFFDWHTIARAMQHVKPRSLTEFRTSRSLTLADGRTVAIVAKVDAIVGTTVSEYKTKWGLFDITEYYESIQWRCYLWAFRAETVNYKVFAMREGAKHAESPSRPEERYRDHPELILDRIHSFSFSAYDTIEDDIREQVRLFLNWIEMRKLEEHLMPKREGALDEL